MYEEHEDEDTVFTDSSDSSLWLSIKQYVDGAAVMNASALGGSSMIFLREHGLELLMNALNGAIEANDDTKVLNYTMVSMIIAN